MTFQVNKFHLGELILSPAGLSGIAQVGQVGKVGEMSKPSPKVRAEMQRARLSAEPCVNVVML